MAKRHRSRSGDLQSIFVRLEELVLANSGRDEFQEIFKLVLAKLYDERFSKTPAFKHDGNADNTYRAVTELLRKAETKWPGVLSPLPEPHLTPEHLCVCVQELQQHSLLDDGLGALDEFFEFIVSKSAKGNKGQYFTPRHLVEMCVQVVRPQAGEIVADPACGSGGFLMQSLQHMRAGAKHAQDLQNNLWGFDIDERATQIARALLIIAGINPPNVFRLNSLAADVDPGLFKTDEILTIEKVMKTRGKDKGVFDVILTNPPFAGEIQERGILDNYDLCNGRSRVERDVLFIERCIRLLKPGGRMAIVLPHNKLSSSDFTDVRSWILQSCHLVSVISVGRNMFMPHTQQKTSVVFLQKKRKARVEKAMPIFFGISEKDGKDSRGNHILRPTNPQMHLCGSGSTMTLTCWSRTFIAKRHGDNDGAIVDRCHRHSRQRARVCP